VQTALAVLVSAIAPLDAVELDGRTYALPETIALLLMQEQETIQAFSPHTHK
jgi:hypothetical protein